MAWFPRREARRRLSGFPTSLSKSDRELRAQRETRALESTGKVLSPVRAEGRAIAKTFWGKAWCHNLEVYGDYANRLPRGRSYLRSGSVIDLRIEPRKVTAQVSGTRLYRVNIDIEALDRDRWSALVADCSGQIDSVIELLEGRMPERVMEAMTRQHTGLFPEPREIHFDCSCPDGARMCKHVAAALYGAGARLDTSPELLFVLRGVEPMELVARIGSTSETPAGTRPLVASTNDLAALFGIELEDTLGPTAEIDRRDTRNKAKNRRPRKNKE